VVDVNYVQLLSGLEGDIRILWILQNSNIDRDRMLGYILVPCCHRMSIYRC